MVFQCQAEASEDWRIDEHKYTYGLHGTPTTLELARRIADLEGAQHTFTTLGGQAAIALIYLSFCRGGGHALVPTTAYGPNRELRGCASQMWNPHGTLRPSDRLRHQQIDNTGNKLDLVRKPRLNHDEVQDVPAIVESAYERGVPVALDNTYSAGIMFDAFSFKVDVSMQALTKYVGGHSDLLLGSVSAGTEEAYKLLGECHKQLGMAASPDDCSLALRGLQTLGVRLDALERSTLEIALWLSEREEVKTVLHPALPSCPGHDLWLRDFKGSTSIFSIVFADHFVPEQVNRFVDSLRLFKIGFNWGGVTSLAMAYPELDHEGTNYAGKIVRLNIGLEDTKDPKEHLASALQVLSKYMPIQTFRRLGASIRLTQ